jgi:hypothetical protein
VGEGRVAFVTASFARYGGEGGHHRLVMSISAFDPIRKSSTQKIAAVQLDLQPHYAGRKSLL